ncbi:MAG: DEAD/DEAH box helicase family protein [Bacteroidetes bacterium]|nr:DEAD/DEAH box helicase family protein [Bacteroidota bacterium]
MTTNFSYLPEAWQALARTAIEAEQQVYAAPMYAAMLCRKSLEEWIRWIYEHDDALEMPQDTSLNSLLHQQAFKELVAPSQFGQINLIRKIGNNAVHSSVRIKSDEALYAVKLLYNFTGWVVRLYDEADLVAPPFNTALVPQPVAADKSKEELQKLEAAYLQSQEALQRVQAELDAIKAVKARNQAYVPPPHDPNEALTRQYYIDALLREAGWEPDAPRVREFPVQGMPTAQGADGTGRADYVLWGDDGLPLAVVEAKRSQHDPRVGAHQAKLYADCLEREFGQRPVVFYSNGYDTWVWDDTRYPPRAVQGFYTRDELQSLVHRRFSRQPLSTAPINEAITDRYYQQEAIRAVGEALEQNRREVLLVMATGTGKTRVAASIIDVLSKAGWIKRVLFLADRNALIHQAKVNLNEYLPHLPAIDLTKEKEDESSRIVFSTYQTIIHMIDGESEGGQRSYGPGHFDLIIFDEIHRSVYNKYKYIFRYFDGIRLGLTATPRAEGDRDTYDLFGLEPHNPTYAYELEQAVNDGFLTPPTAISVPVKFHRQGIRYADLSAEEKRAYEEQFADPITGQFPDEIDAAALNKWLFNEDTVDKVIGYLMEHGIKVEGGDKLGKTIIFARSHEHAKFIEGRFNKQYPQYGGHFLKVIDYQEEYKYDLLNQFKSREKLPQIAVSVDMLDTGIDVPEVVNLLFYKPVRSSAKYWQMIGRGTRLCPDLFGPGDHKKRFVIFDFCENFEFFGQHPQGFSGSTGKSLSQRIFETRLRLAQVLQAETAPALQEYAQQLLDLLIAQTQALNRDSFIVRQHLRVVEKYSDPHRWNALDDQDMRDIFREIAPLVSETGQHEMAKRFDAMMFDLQLFSHVGDKRQAGIVRQVADIAGQLTKKGSIPAVAEKMDMLRGVHSQGWAAGADVVALERIRLDMRDLLRFLEPSSQPLVYSTYLDAFESTAQEHTLLYKVNNLDAYRRKVQQYILQHEQHLVIHKIKTNVPITRAELAELERMLFEQGAIGTREEFVQAYGDQPLGKFIRSIIGLDANAAKTAFAALLQTGQFNSRQIRFIDTIINSFISQGIVEPSRLFESPFTDLHAHGLSGVFDAYTSSRIIELVESVNRNAEVA